MVTNTRWSNSKSECLSVCLSRNCLLFVTVCLVAIATPCHTQLSSPMIPILLFTFKIWLLSNIKQLAMSVETLYILKLYMHNRRTLSVYVHVQQLHSKILLSVCVLRILMFQMCMDIYTCKSMLAHEVHC